VGLGSWASFNREHTGDSSGRHKLCVCADNAQDGFHGIGDRRLDLRSELGSVFAERNTFHADEV
jgi:hypothetical protein